MRRRSIIKPKEGIIWGHRTEGIFFVLYFGLLVEWHVNGTTIFDRVDFLSSILH